MIHIDRSLRARAFAKVVSQGQELLARGIWVIMFPEGTRIPRGERGVYKVGGTKLAVQTGAAVVPACAALAVAVATRAAASAARVVLTVFMIGSPGLMTVTRSRSQSLFGGHVRKVTAGRIDFVHGVCRYDLALDLAARLAHLIAR
jgi:hypothetical protein